MSAEAAAAKAPRRTSWIVWAFATVGVAGVLAFVVLVAMLAHSPGYAPREAKVAAAKGAVLTVVHSGEVEGTGLIRLDVAERDEGGGSSSYSGREAIVRNIVLLDRADGSTRRLLPDNSRTIRHSAFLPAEAEPASEGVGEARMVATGAAAAAAEKETAPAAYFVLTLAHAGDDSLNDVVVGRLVDGAKAAAMRGIDGVDSNWMQSPTRMGFIVREKLALYYRVVDMQTLKVVESRRIEIG